MEELLQQETLQYESRKKLTVFLKILEDKSEIDENYATNLEKISKSFTSLIEAEFLFKKKNNEKTDKIIKKKLYFLRLCQFKIRFYVSIRAFSEISFYVEE